MGRRYRDDRSAAASRHALALLTFMVVFIAAGWFAVELTFPGGGNAPYVPGVGLAAGMVAVSTGWQRLSYLIATFAATILARWLLLGTAPIAGVGFGAANALAASTFALLLVRWLPAAQLATVAGTARFLGASVATAAVGGVLATPSLRLVGGDAPLGPSWLIRSLGQLIALVVVASVVIAWPALRVRLSPRAAAELAAWTVLLGVAVYIGFSSTLAGAGFKYLPLAVVLSAAVRLGGLAPAFLLQALVPASLWFSAHGSQTLITLAQGSPGRTIAAQLFCLIVAATCWLVAARQSEHQAVAERLVVTNAELAGANAGLARANTELTAMNAELEERVAARTVALGRAADAAAVTARAAQALVEARLGSSGTMQALAEVLAGPDGLADVCVVARMTPPSTTLVPVAAVGSTPELTRAAEQAWLPLRVDTASPGVAAQALASGRPIRLGGTTEALRNRSHPALRGVVDHFGLHSAVVAPMHADGQVVGVLSLLRAQPRPPFDDGDERLVQDVADRAGLAVMNAVLHEELTHRALNDPLTGLANRHLLIEQLATAVRRLQRHPGTVAVIFVDLDDFKAVNDGIGHEAGDTLLVHVAARVRSALRGSDTAARFGGDEFVVVCPDLDDATSARTIATRLAEAIAVPVTLASRTVRPRASIGVATTSSALTDPAELLRHADTAMYASKRRGHAQVHVYGEDLVQTERDRLEVQELLHEALAEGWLRLVYQPIVDLRSGKVSAAEALLRIEHPDRGLLTPGTFIDVAETSDVIVAMERWALAQSCSQLAAWRDHHPVELSVNVSGRHVSMPGAADHMLSVIADSGVPTDSVCVEMTERVLLDAQDGVLDNLTTLRAAGVRLALDDFGTGYSPLTYLQTLPIDTVKIDQSFTAALDVQPAGEVQPVPCPGAGIDPATDRSPGRPNRARPVTPGAADTTRGHAIVSALTALGQALDLRMIAEGVETAGQLVQLQALGCDLAQGYYLHVPADAGTVMELLRGGAVLLPAERSAAPRAPATASPALFQDSPDV